MRIKRCIREYKPVIKELCQNMNMREPILVEPSYCRGRKGNIVYDVFFKNVGENYVMRIRPQTTKESLEEAMINYVYKKYGDENDN